MQREDELPELIEFRFSHYNEKARWALERAGVGYRSRPVLPGPHVPLLKKLTGQTETPVLRVGDACIVGSAAIVEYAERNASGPTLYPPDVVARKRALELQSYFDNEVGAPARCAFFHAVLPDGACFCDCYSDDRPGWQRAAYRSLFPLLRRVLHHAYQLDDANAERGRVAIRQAFELVDELAADSGYLVGGAFTIADLSAAALLSPCVLPEQFPVRLPAGIGPRWLVWRDEWRAHPGGQWVLDIYARHRVPVQA